MNDAPARRGATAVLFLALFAVYAWGACRTIYVGDSGELVTAVVTLGIPHPSGYPLYVLLGKLFTLVVPVGSAAFRMSLFSAACAAAAATLLFRLALATGTGGVPALLGALLLAFAPSFWGEANVPRVYALNACFVLLGCLLAVRWRSGRDPRRLVLAFLACGLGASNHTFMAVFAAALGVWALAEEPSLLRAPKTLAACGAAFALGLFPYAFLLLRARQHPVLAWGNPDTLPRLLDVVLRRDYWPRRWVKSPAALPEVVLDFLRGLSVETTLAGAALALLALALSRGREARRLLLLPLLVIAGNLCAVALHGSRKDIFLWHRYDIPAYVMLAWLAALGAEALGQRLGDRTRLLVPLLLLAPAWLLATGWTRFDRHRYAICEAYSRAVLDSVPPGAHLVASDDNVLFSLIYLRHVERLRPDVDLVLQGVGGESPPPLHFDPDTDPLFYANHPNWNVPGLSTIPAGLVFRIARAGRPVPPPSFPIDRLPGEDDPRVPKDDLTRDLIGLFHYMRALSLLGWDHERSDEEFRRAFTAAPDDDVLAFNVGLIRRGQGRLEEALEAFRAVKRRNPTFAITPGQPSPPDPIPDLEEELRRRGTPSTP